MILFYPGGGVLACDCVFSYDPRCSRLHAFNYYPRETTDKLPLSHYCNSSLKYNRNIFTLQFWHDVRVMKLLNEVLVSFLRIFGGTVYISKQGKVSPFQ